MAGNHSVAQKFSVGQTEIGGPVGDEGVYLHEAALVHQQRQALPSGKLASLVLLVNALLTTAFVGPLTHLLKHV